MKVYWSAKLTLFVRRMAWIKQQISLAKKTPYFEIFRGDRNLMRWRAAVVLASATMFITCLTQAAFVTECCYVEGDIERISGLVILLIGWGECSEAGFTRCCSC